ncbi:transglycosylase domain-containing protein [Jeotgalibacillus soli]|uniref:Peptidoglycan glycosyltransferase n=1 Tax=Jeotgalibacillus soli TaxID=889306 RepID=A0A0C2V4B3_9BACL|nr:transglycosylase domain-containing protein [Jeotgalibacillus soli]KIL43872.1 peptidoglycan glycosyltransferase [Jeotgalibacillus soli]
MNERIKDLRKRATSFFTRFNSGSWRKNTRISYQVFWNICLILIILGVMGGAFAGGVGAGYFASLVKDEEIIPFEMMESNIYDYTETSDLYFANDVYLGKLRTDLEREEVVLENVSPYLINAVIATEDEYFMEHDGVVPKAIMRALFQEVTNSAVQTGGSTLTQQLIKNQILTNEVSFDRKAKEILLALRLERFFEKDEIIEAYLNVADMGRNSSGRNIAGVQTAAKGIFGVEAKDLTLPQAAFIAGLPQAPFGYTPFTNVGERKDEAGLQPGLQRMQEVLSRMLREESITQEEYDQALAYDITADFIPASSSSIDEYPWVTRELESRATEIIAVVLAERDGYSEQQLEDSKPLKDEYEQLADRDIRQNGYKIHSTIDKELYDAMEEVKNNFNDFGPNHNVTRTNLETEEEVIVSEPVQVGGILLENGTGRIISFTGGRDFDQEQLNHATQSYRSSGSTIKPIAVYAPAIEFGLIGAGTPLADVKFSYRGWNPDNYSYREYGLVPARTALAASHNLSAARLYGKMQSQGLNPGEFLEKMNPEKISSAEYENPSFSLGGMATGISVEENTAAYATLGNMGQYVEPYMIEKIVDKNGEVIYEHKTESIQVYSPATAYITLDMMRDTMTPIGTGRSAPRFLNFTTDWAAKSGTSQDFHDNWFIATNPNITFGMWFGYGEPESLYDNGQYNTRTINLWANMMNRANELRPELIDPPNSFQQPDGVVNRAFCSFTGQAATDACSQAGLVTSDLFPSSFAFSGASDALLVSRYVTLNGVRYVALDSTPAEFSSNGALLSPDYAEQMLAPYGGNAAGLFPEGNSFFDNLLVAQNRLEDDGSNPAGVTATATGSGITWTPSGSGDVVGYRVKNTGGSTIVSRKADENLTASLPNGTYYVVAVDVAGKESTPSNEIQIGAPTLPPPAQEKEENDAPATPVPPTTPPPSSGNGGNEEDPPEETEPPEVTEPAEEEQPAEETPPEETPPPDEGNGE